MKRYIKSSAEVSEVNAASSFEPDSPEDNRRRWKYKGWTMKWNKEKEVWELYSPDEDYSPEWEADTRAEAKSWIDSAKA